MFDLMPFDIKNPSILEELNSFEKNLFAPIYSRANFRTDIVDNDSSYLLEAELPGFSKEDITISVNGEYLTIKAMQNATKMNSSENVGKDVVNSSNYIRKERITGTFERSFRIPNINSANVEANYNNGMLHVTIPKIEKKDSVAKYITIK